MPQNILNERDAAALVGLSVHTLRARRFKGLEPEFLKLGRSVRYEREALERFLESCKVRVGGKAA
jgi:predicted DNA-binding transcriptional regulator AlpA